MRVSRELPDDLVRQLRRARDLEHAAETFEQQRNTVHATATLMLAAVEHGWLVKDVAAAVGLSPGTASRRINDARRRRGDAPTGLALDRPAPVRGALAELATPVEKREWLSRGEAAAYLDVAPDTIQSLYRAGLLPNSRSLTGTWRVYLRADLERVRDGPRKGPYLDRAALRAVITSEHPYSAVRR